MTDLYINSVEDHVYAIIRTAVFNVQICTTVPPDQTINLKLLALQLNEDHPCGTENGWVIEMNDPAPGKCNDHKDRYHYVCPC